MPHAVDHAAILDRIAQTRGGERNVLQRIDPARTAHLIVDMQNGFVEEGAPVEVPMAREVTEEINRISAALRDAGGTNVFIRYTTPADENEWSTFVTRLGPLAEAHIGGFRRGEHHWQLWPELDVRDEDLLVEKRRFSPFVPGASDLHEVLQARGIDTVIVTGTMTNCCCEATARDAMQMNYRTIFVPDANAASTDAEHAATLHTMGRIFADLWSSEEIAAMLERVETPA